MNELSETTSKKPMPYRIGQWIGSHLWLSFGLVVLAWILWPSGSSKQIEPPQSVQVAPNEKALAEQKAKEQAKNDQCKAGLDESKKQYQAAMKAGKHWEAAASIRNCTQILKIDELKVMLQDAEVKSYVSSISDPDRSAYEIDVAYTAMKRDYPDAALKFQKLHEQKTKLAIERDRLTEKRNKDVIAKTKRSEGVSIGMSQEDVLASSWASLTRSTEQQLPTAQESNWSIAAALKDICISATARLSRFKTSPKHKTPRSSHR